MLILATDATEKSQNTYLWHENVHRAIDQLGLSDEEVYTVSEAIRVINPKKCLKIRELYGEENYREEIVTVWFHSYYYEKGDEGLPEEINGFDGEAKRLLLSIYNYVKYGKRENDERGRAGRGGTPSGRTEEEDGKGSERRLAGSGLSMRNSVSEGGSKKSGFKGAAKAASGGFFGRSAGAEALEHLGKVAAAAQYILCFPTSAY